MVIKLLGAVVVVVEDAYRVVQVGCPRGWDVHFACIRMRQMPNDAAARAECARVIRTGQRRFLQVLTLGEIS